MCQRSTTGFHTIFMLTVIYIDVLSQPGEGGLPHREDHEPSDPQLQALHHGERQLDDMGSGKTQ